MDSDYDIAVAAVGNVAVDTEVVAYADVASSNQTSCYDIAVNDRLVLLSPCLLSLLSPETNQHSALLRDHYHLSVDEAYDCPA